MKTRNIFFIVFILSVVWSTNAQETIQKDVHVVREYAPSVSDAQKLNQMPHREDTLTVSPQFRYQVPGKAMVTTPEIGPIPPASLAGEPKDELYSSYVRAGLGNYELLFGDIYYNLLRNEKFALALKLGQESSWGELELEDGETVESPYHQTNGGFYLRHFFDDKTLSLDLDFRRHAYNYYGFQTIDESQNYYGPSMEDGSSEILAGADLIPEKDQRLSSFDAELKLSGQQADIDETRFNVGLGLGAFGNKTGVNENRISLKGDLKKPFDNLIFSVDGGLDFFNVSEPSANERPGLWQFAERQQTLVTLNPRVVFNPNSLTIEGGLNFTGVLDDLGDEFYLAPHLTANLLVAEGIVSAFGGVTGEVRPANYQRIMAENPFVSPDVHVKSAFHNLMFFAGVKGNFSSSTSFSARVDYEFLTNEHFFVNRTFLNQLTVDDFGASNLFDVQYDDGTLLTLSGELLVKPVTGLDILLKGAYYDWTLDHLAQPWHRPDMELGLRGQYRWNNNLLLSAAFNVLGKRMAEDRNAVDGMKQLESVADFNLGGDYQFTSRLHFFARVQNLFGDKYYRWSGYPMQGVNFRVGAGYSF
jgi:outer membrane receptor protein involved in Fe transport